MREDGNFSMFLCSYRNMVLVNQHSDFLSKRSCVLSSIIFLYFVELETQSAQSTVKIEQ